MQHLESSGTPVLYIARMALKGYACSHAMEDHVFGTSTNTFSESAAICLHGRCELWNTVIYLPN
jgi:hypothetical protein